MTKELMTLCFSLLAISGMSQTNDVVEDFDRIIAHGGGNVKISHSDEHQVKVKASGPCAEFVKISVSSKTLYIAIEDQNEHACDLTVYVSVPLLDEIVLKGGGNIVVEKGFNPKDTFQCEIRGGGNIDVSELSVESFDASIKGGGTILLTVRKELEGDISGGGIIEYFGNPKVDRHVSGGGSVRKK